MTSNDSTYRDKLTKITDTLSNLAQHEKFFSIDEFGPFSVKIRGGTALVAGDVVRTIPQRQMSKGSLICTAALELSTNQVTHFYSKTKNTREMVKLLKRLSRSINTRGASLFLGILRPGTLQSHFMLPSMNSTVMNFESPTKRLLSSSSPYRQGLSF